jgi:ubiquitin-like protein Pup
MAGQEQTRPTRREDEPADDAPPPAAPAGQTQTSDADVDAILDEIDDVLESNAEEFVKGFVQKGGQ